MRNRKNAVNGKETSEVAYLLKINLKLNFFFL